VTTLYWAVAGALLLASSALTFLMLRRHLELWIGAQYFITFAWVGASVLYIEQGIFIVEQWEYSHMNGATLLHLAVSGIFLISFGAAVLGIARATPRIGHGKALDSQAMILFVGAALAMVVLLLNAALSPLPFFNTELDRFDFWRLSRFPFLQSLFGNTATVLVFAFGLAYVRARAAGASGLARACQAATIVYYVYLILIGHAFSALLTATIVVLIPVLAVGPEPRFSRIPRRFVVGLALLCSVMIGFKLWQYYARFNPYARTLRLNPVQALTYRALGLQGHVWWGVVEQRMHEGAPPELNVGRLKDGMPHLMRTVGHRITTRSLERGVSFTTGYPAILLLLLPVWAIPVLQIVAGIVAGALAGITIALARTGHLLLSAVSLQLTLWLQYCLVMGSFSRLLSASFLGGLGILALGWLVTRLATKTRTPGAPQPASAVYSIRRSA